MINSRYITDYDTNVLKDISKINEKISQEKDSDTLLKLRMQRLYRGMELNSASTTRNYRGIYPY